MAKLTVTCDVCNKVLSVDEAHYDYSNERDLCGEHYIQGEIDKLLDQRRSMSNSLASVKAELRALDDKIDELRNPRGT